MYFKHSLISIFFGFFSLMLKVQRRKSYLSRFILHFAEAYVVFRVPLSYQFYKDNILNFKLLMIIFVSQENPFFHPSILLTSRENTAPYKTLFPPTACFIMPAFFTSAQFPSLIHLLGLFLPWDMKSECVAKLSEKVLFFVLSI